MLSHQIHSAHPIQQAADLIDVGRRNIELRAVKPRVAQPTWPLRNA
ncbi:hypothetical protein CA85_35200 [Allorhodopirellula solitaria]|uniref:Uncharacterized protein n=1 Tax=Allorhodopirellula solitaria TaxID=2527987 RepID=A0A5C5XRT0_9BACT|nr:hypothetical protein CA85_35200 [Allorhodopirellula solitaria]